MKKIVFLDIDGTLVTPNYPLSDFVKKGIKKSNENGLQTLPEILIDPTYSQL